MHLILDHLTMLFRSDTACLSCLLCDGEGPATQPSRKPPLLHTSPHLAIQGEGELKLLAKLQDQGGGRGAPTPGDTHVILGGDSDLYLIALVAPRPSVFIAADADIPHLGAPADQLTVFSRAALANVWGPHADVARLGLDLCLLAVLTSGNDYLPAIQASLGWVGGNQERV